MERETERKLAAHAVELGCRADPAVLPELIVLLDTPSSEVRRLVASAIGKLAGLADAGAAVAALTRTLRDRHPQVRQYAVKALKAYGTASESALADLRDIAANETVVMDTLDYKIGMLIKQQMYQHAGKRLISLYPQDKPNLDAILSEKLLRIRPIDSASAPSTLGLGAATRSKSDNLTQKGTQT